MPIQFRMPGAVTAPSSNGVASAPPSTPRASRAPTPPTADTAPISTPATTVNMGHGRRDVPLLCSTCHGHVFNTREGKVQQAAVCIATQAKNKGLAPTTLDAMALFARAVGITDYAGKPKPAAT